MSDWAVLSPAHSVLDLGTSFLRRGELLHFINRLIREAKQHGELHGLTLASVNDDAIEILQAYVDNTGAFNRHNDRCFSTATLYSRAVSSWS